MTCDQELPVLPIGELNFSKQNGFSRSFHEKVPHEQPFGSEILVLPAEHLSATGAKRTALRIALVQT